MTVELTADVRARLDAHLDAVEEALRASGRTREQRRGIVDDLEAQILDMLAGRSSSPTATDLDAVLNTLDPPAAYRDGGAATPNSPAAPAAARPPATAPPPPRTPTRYSRTAIVGFVLILVSLLPLVLAAAVLAMTVTAMHPPVQSVSTTPGMPTIHVESPDRTVVIDSGQTNTIHVESPDHRVVIDAPNAVTMRQRSAWGFMALPCISLSAAPLALAGTVLGWIAFFQIRASGGAVRGLGLALFDGLFYPVIALGLLLLSVA